MGTLPPEQYGTDWFLSCLQEGVEHTPLQRGRDAPLDVPFHNQLLCAQESKLTQNHVVGPSNQSDYSTYLQ